MKKISIFLVLVACFGFVFSVVSLPVLANEENVSELKGIIADMEFALGKNEEALNEAWGEAPKQVKPNSEFEGMLALEIRGFEDPTLKEYTGKNIKAIFSSNSNHCCKAIVSSCPKLTKYTLTEVEEALGGKLDNQGEYSFFSIGSNMLSVGCDSNRIKEISLSVPMSEL